MVKQRTNTSHPMQQVPNRLFQLKKKLRTDNYTFGVLLKANPGRAVRTSLGICDSCGEWHQGIIVPIYKGRGSRSEGKNYRGITLLSVPGKVFMHVILSHIKPTLLACRRQEQSGFTPNCSTTDRILTLCNLARQRREFSRPMYTTYVDLSAAFHSLSRPALWLLLARCGIPKKLILLIRALYDGQLCTRWKPNKSGVSYFMCRIQQHHNYTAMLGNVSPQNPAIVRRSSCRWRLLE